MSEPVAMSGPELHLASLVLHVVPRRLDACLAAATLVAGAEVHARSPAGKIVVTLEASSDSDLQAGIAALQAIAGVIAATLVYQHAEPLASMTEEVHADARDEGSVEGREAAPRETLDRTQDADTDESPAPPASPLHQAVRSGGRRVDGGDCPARGRPEPGH